APPPLSSSSEALGNTRSVQPPRPTRKSWGGAFLEPQNQVSSSPSFRPVLPPLGPRTAPQCSNIVSPYASELQTVCSQISARKSAMSGFTDYSRQETGWTRQQTDRVESMVK